MTMVRGREVSFSRDAINAYLGNPLTLEEGALCEYGKRLAKGNWNIELVKDALVKVCICFIISIRISAMPRLFRN